MNLNYLDFEQPVAELEAKIEELRLVNDSSGINIREEIDRLTNKSIKLTQSIFSALKPWQIAQLARHPLRPYVLDYIPLIFSDFRELKGDRMFADDPAIIGGLAHLEGIPVVVLGHQKGRETRDKLRHNFGMPKPEGYRKAQRLMKLAERFQLPLVTLIDTPGAYPGIVAEERGQSESIAVCLQLMSRLRTPIVSVVVGEGGSGGALAIGVCDRLLMLEYAVYSVISPEGCASILWNEAAKAPIAAEAMKITSRDQLANGLVDRILAEPLGGAHRNVREMADTIGVAVLDEMQKLQALEIDDLLQRRYQRLLDYGSYEEISA